MPQITNGALFVGDDENGVIYRVTYGDGRDEPVAETGND
jgi:hypothetical protein